MRTFAIYACKTDVNHEAQLAAMRSGRAARDHFRVTCCETTQMVVWSYDLLARYDGSSKCPGPPHRT